MNCMNKNPMDSMIDSSYILTNALVYSNTVVIKDPKTQKQHYSTVAAFKISDLIFLEDPKNIS